MMYYNTFGRFYDEPTNTTELSEGAKALEKYRCANI
jgi:hypothetical protein